METLDPQDLLVFAPHRSFDPEFQFVELTILKSQFILLNVLLRFCFIALARIIYIWLPFLQLALALSIGLLLNILLRICFIALDRIICIWLPFLHFALVFSIVLHLKRT